MKTTLAIIEQAFAEQGPCCLAFSGGSDSTVLVDILYRLTPHRPPLVWADTGMEYPETETHVRAVATRYGAELHVAKASREPLDQWTRHGWPMLGKQSDGQWTRNYRHQEFGFRLGKTACCRSMKIAPARRLMRQLGFALHFTGQRGGEDDRTRGKHVAEHGPIQLIKSDRLWIANPLTGWTDFMIRRYTQAHHLPRHPAWERGASTIGCMYCGGGAQFDGSCYPVLRRTDPAAWWRFMVDWKGGLVILAIKYAAPLTVIEAAVERLGGLAHLAQTRPWIFDYLRLTPLQGYTR